MGEGQKSSFIDVVREANMAALRPVSTEDVQRVQDMRPYLELMAVDLEGQPHHIADVDALPEHALDTAAYGVPTYIGIVYEWNIQYWPGASTWPSILSASPGAQVYYGNQPIFNEAVQPVGTLKGQSFEVAVFMILLVQEQGWPAVYLTSGSSTMLCAAWMIAQAVGLHCFGFEPTEADHAHAKRVMPVIEPLLSAPLMYQLSSSYASEALMLGEEVQPSVLIATEGLDEKGLDESLDTAAEFGEPAQASSDAKSLVAEGQAAEASTQKVDTQKVDVADSDDASDAVAATSAKDQAVEASTQEVDVANSDDASDLDETKSSDEADT